MATKEGTVNPAAGVPPKFGEPPPEDHEDDVPVASTMVLEWDDSGTKWKDVPWAIAFYIHVLAIVVLAFAIGVSEKGSTCCSYFASTCIIVCAWLRLIAQVPEAKGNDRNYIR